MYSGGGICIQAGGDMYSGVGDMYSGGGYVFRQVDMYSGGVGVGEYVSRRGGVGDMYPGYPSSVTSQLSRQYIRLSVSLCIIYMYKPVKK